MFCLGQFTLDYYYPEQVNNYYIWTDYIMAKDKMYDFMFFLISIVLFWNTKGISKALSCFFVLISGSSFIDKVIFHFNMRLESDIFMLFVVIGLSGYLYIKKWKI
jgi:hypothetical protein